MSHTGSIQGFDAPNTILDGSILSSVRVPVLFRIGSLLLTLAMLVATYLGLAAMGKLPDLDSSDAHALFFESRWGHIGGIPLAFAGAALYGGLLMLSRSVVKARVCWLATVGLGLALIVKLAAVWFIVVQCFFVGGLCGWCGMTHALAVTGAALLIIARDIQRPTSSRRSAVVSAALAMTAITAMALIQLRQPSKAITVTVALDPDRVAVNAVTSDFGSSKLVSLYGCRYVINPANFPVIGSVTANEFIVVVTDYTSPDCRALHRHLVDVQRAYGEQLGVIELPGASSPDAKAIQRSMLTLRELRSHNFAAISENIYSSKNLGELKHEHVLREILKRVPGETFHQAEEDFHGRVDSAMTLASEIRQANLKNGGSAELPQVIIGSALLSGVADDPGFYVEKIRNHLGILFPTRGIGKADPAAKSPPVPELDKAKIELGPVAPGAEIPVVIRVTNSGQSPLQITWVRFEDNCRLLEIPRDPIPFGKSAEVRFLVTIPDGKLGRFERTLTIHSNAGNEGNTVRIEGQFDPGRRLRTLSQSASAAP